MESGLDHATYIALRNAQKGPLCNLQTTQAQISLCIQGLRCPIPESMDTVLYIDEQRRLRHDCTDAHADLGFRCSHMA